MLTVNLELDKETDDNKKSYSKLTETHILFIML